MVFGSLFVVICGFVLLNAIDTSRFNRSSPISKVAVPPENRISEAPQPERPKRLPPPRIAPSGQGPQNKPSPGETGHAAELSPPSVMKARLSRLGAAALERMVRFDSQPFEQHVDVPGLGFAEVAPRGFPTQSFKTKLEKGIVTASATATSIPSAHQQPTIAEEEDTAARRKPDEASLEPESLTEQQMSRAKSRLRDLGFLSFAKRGGWDANARNALRDFKVANGLPNDDVWDLETSKQIDSRSAVRADQSIIGNWSTAPCRSAKPGSTMLSVTSRRAKSSAGSVCEFQELRATAREWRVKAACSRGEKHWAAKGKFALSADKLVWYSEGDVISYFRCEAAVR
jgi:hypothetical protein